MTEVPPSQDEFDDADELYRRASALDGSRPSEPVRRAILKHAAELAAARAADNAGSKAVKQRSARQAWWRPAAFGTLAAAALAGLLVTPQFIAHHTPNTTASLQSAAKSAPAAPSVTPAPSVPAPQNAPMEEIVVTEQRAAKAEQRAARAEQYAAQQRSRNAASQPAAQDELQEQASADAQDKRRTANDLGEPSKLAEQSKASAAKYGELARNQAQSDALVGSGSPPAAPAAAQAGASTAGADAATALNGLVAGRPAGLMDPTAQLRRAAEMGDVPALQALLEKQPAIDARDAGGRTALMLATLRGRAEAVDVLLSFGADPNAADARGTTPLQAALAAHQAAIAEALRRAGAKSDP